VRTYPAPASLVAADTRVIQGVDPQVAVARVRPLTAALENVTWEPRLWTVVVTLFALSALLITLVGLFGVTAAAVTQRAQEFAIRAAVGARPLDLLWIVQRETGLTVGVGLLAGVAATVALVPRPQGLLQLVDSLEWRVVGGVALAVGLCGLACAALPARRAARSASLAAVLRG